MADGTTELQEKACSKCGEVRPHRRYARVCVECSLAKDEGAATGQRRKGGGKRAKKEDAPKLNAPRFSRPSGLGYELYTEVDANTKQTDIVIKQIQTDSEVRIWLNQLEAAEIHSWLTETLGLA